MSGDAIETYIQNWGAEDVKRHFASQAAEIERLKETVRVHKVWEFPADIQALTVRAETAERRLAEARAALEPFAKVAKNITPNFDDAAIVSVGINFTLSPEDVASIEAHPRGGKLRDNRSTLIVSLDGINAGHFRTATRTLTNGGENGR